MGGRKKFVEIPVVMGMASAVEIRRTGKPGRHCSLRGTAPVGELPSYQARRVVAAW